MCSAETKDRSLFSFSSCRVLEGSFSVHAVDGFMVSQENLTWPQILWEKKSEITDFGSSSVFDLGKFVSCVLNQSLSANTSPLVVVVIPCLFTRWCCYTNTAEINYSGINVFWSVYCYHHIKKTVTFTPTTLTEKKGLGAKDIKLNPNNLCESLSIKCKFFFLDH